MTVKSIRASIKTRIAAASTAVTYTEAKHTFELDKNSNLGHVNKYALAIGTQVETPGVTRFATMDQIFLLTLTKEFKNSKDDSGILDKVEDMHADLDTLYSDFVNTRVNNADVMNVFDRSISEPVVNYEDKTIALEMAFNIKYRFAT